MTDEQLQFEMPYNDIAQQLKRILSTAMPVSLIAREPFLLFHVTRPTMTG